MKIIDNLKLAKYECRYGKREWVLSLSMNIIIMTCILLSLTITFEISSAFNDYISKGYMDGYSFELKGFNESDIEWLDSRGFKDIIFIDEEMGYAVTKDISNIWIYKLQALSEGKDIWNEGIDLMLEVMLFASIIFMSISVVLFIIMINSNSNSFCMKLKERERYIDMLIYLGMTKKDCIRFFMTFFVLRVMVALLFATCINGILIMTINNYIHNVLKIDTAFSNIKPTLVTAIFVLSIVIMNISFLRVWRNKE